MISYHTHQFVFHKNRKYKTDLFLSISIWAAASKISSSGDGSSSTIPMFLDVLSGSDVFCATMSGGLGSIWSTSTRAGVNGGGETSSPASGPTNGGSTFSLCVISLCCCLVNFTIAWVSCVFCGLGAGVVNGTGGSFVNSFCSCRTLWAGSSQAGRSLATGPTGFGLWGCSSAGGTPGRGSGFTGGKYSFFTFTLLQKPCVCERPPGKNGGQLEFQPSTSWPKGLLKEVDGRLFLSNKNAVAVLAALAALDVTSKWSPKLRLLGWYGRSVTSKVCNLHLPIATAVSYQCFAFNHSSFDPFQCLCCTVVACSPICHCVVKLQQLSRDNESFVPWTSDFKLASIGHSESGRNSARHEFPGICIRWHWHVFKI